MNDIGRQLQERFPVLAKLPPALWAQLLAQAPVRDAAAGERLFDRDSPCEGFPLLLDGAVRVSTVSEAGREIVLYRVSAGEGCVLSGSCLLSQHDYMASGTAETDVTLVRIPPALFETLIAQSADFRRFVFDMYGARLTEVMALVEEVAFRKMDTRLARLLVQQGPVLHTTHQSLADELGSVRVFVSRVLKSFEDRGWVRLERERIVVLDLRALAEFAKG